MKWQDSLQIYKRRIKQLELFTNLKEEDINFILTSALIKKYKESDTVFYHGEQLQYFFIILEGKIRLLRGDIEGNEITFSVNTQVNPIVEIDTINEGIHNLTAQTIENTILLAIPIADFRRHINYYKIMALNMLSIVSRNYKHSIDHIEQLTLKSGIQRVGWFFLQLFLGSQKKDKVVQLPYRKALIANFLGIKPETFSRTMQHLKKSGINISKNNISLVSDHYLCKYCNIELAKLCPNSKSDQCISR
jgi:CRP-like cAMP-binding protein